MSIFFLLFFLFLNVIIISFKYFGNKNSIIFLNNFLNKTVNTVIIILVTLRILVLNGIYINTPHKINKIKYIEETIAFKTIKFDKNTKLYK